MWPINNILPRTDNSTVKNHQRLSFLFIPHGLDEIYLSVILNCINLSQRPYIHKLTTEERTDGQTNTMFIGRSLSTGRAMCNGKSEWKKQHTVPNVCQNRNPYRTQTLFQYSASPAPILGTTENATFANFMEKSMHLKTGFL